MTSSAPDIHDIRAPYLIPPDWRIPALIAVGVLALVALLWWAWRRARARHRPLTLLQRTLRDLAATQPLMLANDAEGFSVAVSDIVRGYVEARFRVQATQRTTTEFLRDCLAQVGSQLQAHEAALAEFLRYCDLAKFARWSLDQQAMQSMLDSARHFVETTAETATSPSAIAPESPDVPIRQS